MKHWLNLSPLLVLAALAVSCEKSGHSTKALDPVPFSDVRIKDSFWTPRLLIHKDVTLPVCIDQIENQTGRIRNFENAAKGEGEHSGIYYDDSDVYKALEGMAYSLQIEPDPVLEAKCDAWIDKFAAAQQPDGYLNTYYTLTGLENRWKNMDKHEMYCAGHMTEAAVAYYKATGKRKLLDVAIRFADHMMSVFGPEGRHWVPGHEEIELALVKLFEVTGEKKYLDFAGWLLDQRGHGYGSYGDERTWPATYYQDEVPVRDLSRITGHAVRSMYLYCGMADVAAYTGDKGLTDALDRLWDHVVNRNMYVTGGIGQSSHNEGITEDYDLPNLTAYCETCASVGMVLWNWRMLQFTGDGKYADVMERSLYNGALAGISLKGDRFFYVNPLESEGDHHRQAWYGCACCPSQICRFLPSVGNYVYGTSNEALWVNLYMGSETTVKLKGRDIRVKQETSYPWNGGVKLTLGMDRPVKTEIRLRIPAWCKVFSFSVNGMDANEEVTVEQGYAVLARKWTDGDVVELYMDMPVEEVAADPRVKEDMGKRAIQRGPIVYCLEEVDNPEAFDSLRLTEDAYFDVAPLDKDQWWGHPLMEITAFTGAEKLTFIPYFAWDNREAGKMKVWIPLKAEFNL